MVDSIGIAAGLGDAPQVQRWLADGHSPVQENSRGKTALDIAAEADQQAVAELMVKRVIKDDYSVAKLALTRAIQNGHLLLVKLFLKHGVDPNEVDRESGDYPLHTAVRKNNLTILNAVLSAGASPAVLHGLSHASPEQLAEALRYTEAAKVLKQHMAALKAESEKAAVKEPASEGKGKVVKLIGAVVVLALAITAVAVVPKGKK